MAQVVNRASITSLLYQGMSEIYFMFKLTPSFEKKIYKEERVEQSTTYDLEMAALPMFQVKQEGAPTAMGDMGQTPIKTAYVITTYSMGFSITAEAIEDNMYKNAFPHQAKQLANSYETHLNFTAAYDFNNAFNMESVGGDGQPMCSTNHPVAYGTFSNTFLNGVDFDESALEDAIDAIRNFVAWNGMPLDIMPERLVGPTKKVFMFDRVRLSSQMPGTANNDINPIYNGRWIPKDSVTTPYIQEKGYWFVVTDAEQGFKKKVKRGLTIDFMTDTVTDNTIVKGSCRDAFGYSNSRCVFGSWGL